MARRITISCDDCEWATTTDTPARAEYARSRHSCARWQAKSEARARRLARSAAVDRTPKPCAHLIAQHEHGSYACYVLDSCSCIPCATANSTYERRRTRQQAYGRDAYVDATPVREHLRTLMAAGLGWKRIAGLAGLADSTIYPILYGKAGKPPRPRVRAATRDAILAVPYPDLDALGATVTVPAVGTTRRVRALIALGWSVQRLADRIPDGDRQALDTAVNGALTVTALTARRVRDLYAQLKDTPPPATTPGQRGSAERARRRAARAGWLTSAWWGADVIDEPTDEPDESDKSDDALHGGRWVQHGGVSRWVA